MLYSDYWAGGQQAGGMLDVIMVAALGRFPAVGGKFLFGLPPQPHHGDNGGSQTAHSAFSAGVSCPRTGLSTTRGPLRSNAAVAKRRTPSHGARWDNSRKRSRASTARNFMTY